MPSPSCGKPAVKPKEPMPISLLMRRHLLAAGQMADLGRACLQRLGGIVDGRGADADHDDPLAAQGGEVDARRRNAPSISPAGCRRSRGCRDGRGRRGRWPSPPCGRGPSFARALAARASAAAASPSGRMRHDLDAVLDRQVEHLAVPAQVVHPHRPGDAEELLPGRRRRTARRYQARKVSEAMP